MYLAFEGFLSLIWFLGCETVKAVQNESLTYLVVGLANSDSAHDEGLSCPNEEKLTFNGSAADNICACRHAQKRSFVLPYNPRTGTFNYRNTVSDQSALQELYNGPDDVTEITPLPLKDCCLAFQVASGRGDTQLYTLDMVEVGGVEQPRVAHFANVDLPPFVEKTAWGHCSDDTIYMSYTREGFITGNFLTYEKLNNSRWKSLRNTTSSEDYYLFP